MQQPLFWIVPLASLLALAFAWSFFRQMKRQDEGNETMRRIAGHVRRGAMAYLTQQYKVVALFFLGVALLLAFLSYGLGIQNPWVPFAFLTAGFFSALAGFFGMKTATSAAARTAQAATRSLDGALRIAFRSGAVMGLAVVGLALLDISVWFFVLNRFAADGDPIFRLALITTTMLTFGMGASLQALFARVGGGIYTKAADVGADLVGKVEAGIPEDDPRNPATIADNVGDNVGDVAGMGADLYESYFGSILATCALGAAAYAATGDAAMQFDAVVAPMAIAALGVFLSLAGVFAVRIKEGAGSDKLMGALHRGVNLSSVLVAAASYGLLRHLDIDNYLGVWAAVVTGLATGLVIGKATEFSTSQNYRPTRNLAEQARTGPATVIIAGMGVGFHSTAIPVVAVALGMLLAFFFGTGGLHLQEPLHGLYGIGIAAVGMLSTLGITLATDAYGPIADNAGGNAEMSELGPETRRRTDALDALGNTTAATGKGFAIGSAALTALALLASYAQAIKMAIANSLDGGDGAPFVFPDGSALAEAGEIAALGVYEFMDRFQIHLLNPFVLAGLFVGSMTAFVFCGLTMNAVGRAAGRMVEEARRQFREIEGILEGKAEPDYALCVAISTRGAQREMALPTVCAVAIPVATGLLLGAPGVFGLLAGALSTGFILAVFMANAGGAWDNAKKYIEEGNLGGKGSEAHKATVIGDTVGDPFKDTSGPSLNILIKLMTMVSIVAAGVTVSFSLF